MIERLLTFSTSELCDGASNPRPMDYHIKPWVGEKRIAGRAVTVDVPAGEGDLIADAILQLKEGDVLVIAGKGCCRCSYWGDFRSFCAKRTRAAGVVIDGAFRDVEECREIGFPIFARAVTCPTAAKNGTGQMNVPVDCGGVRVQPGDLIVGDENGVCVIDPKEAEAIMEKAEKKRAAQERTMREMEETGVLYTRIKK